MKYRSTKTFGNDRGLSCCFRQWRATSHCRLLHGYALGVHLEFEADELDERHWVYDFGNMRRIRGYLDDLFDHKLIIAADDPEIEAFKALHDKGLCSLRVLTAVGCEAFALLLFETFSPWVEEESQGRVRLVEVKVFEHAANAARVLE